MVTENCVVDGEECLLTWEDDGKSGKVPLQPRIIHNRANYPQWGIIQSGELSSMNEIHHLGFTVKLPAVGFIAAMYLGTVWC